MKCQICFDFTNCNRYGAQVCAACGIFFRRHILYPKLLVCKFSNNCDRKDWKIMKCSSCRLIRCFQIGMKGNRVNYYKSNEQNSHSLPVQYLIFAQVLESLAQVCQNDRTGTIRYLTEGDQTVLNIAAIRFTENQKLSSLSRKAIYWARILYTYEITQNELSLLFQLLACHISFIFHHFHEAKVNLKKTELNSRFYSLRNMCYRLINEM